VSAHWDVIVVGGGPAGLAAATVAAAAGASTLVLEKAEHPRYKTCGGGLVGFSLTALAALPVPVEVPVREQVDRISFSLRGRREFTRRDTGPLVAMVQREEFDLALCRAAQAAGAQVRPRATVRTVDQAGDTTRVTLAGGEELTAGVVVGADGSSGITARYVGVRYEQGDLGL
jgi:flavin-dependent dehydrogenase